MKQYKAEMKLSRKIKKIRNSNHLTFQQFAEKVHVPPKTVKRWESGQWTPSQSKINDLCEMFNITDDYLLVDSSKNKERRKNHKKIIIAITFVLIVASLIYVSYKPIMTKISNNEKVLFDTGSNEYIILDGKSINLGKMKTLKFDLDSDGKKEEFLIGRDTPNGIKIDGITNQTGQNLYYDIDFKNAFDDYGVIKDSYNIQISLFDFNNDSTKEVAVSVGNFIYEMKTFIFKITKSTGKPFEYIGSIDGQTKMNVDNNHSIIAPYGSQGLFNEFKYKNSNLYEVDTNGLLKLIPIIVNTDNLSNEEFLKYYINILQEFNQSFFKNDFEKLTFASAGYYNDRNNAIVESEDILNETIVKFAKLENIKMKEGLGLKEQFIGLLNVKDNYIKCATELIDVMKDNNTISLQKRLKDFNDVGISFCSICAQAYSQANYIQTNYVQPNNTYY